MTDTFKNHTKLIDITYDNLHLVKTFLDNAGVSLDTFRYFHKRTIEEAFRTHITTLILLYDGMPIGYGHLSHDGNDVWLGICIAHDYIGRGFGGFLITELMSRKPPGSKISLNVDKDNEAAIRLYEKMGFVKKSIRMQTENCD